MKKVPAIFIAIIFLYFPYAVLADESLNWQDCVREAAKNNPQLISAVEVVNQQKSGRDITASGLLPQVTVSGGASRTKTTTQSASGSRLSTIANSYSYGLSGSQLIFDGFKKINDTNSAVENIKAAEQGYLFTSSSVRLNLRSAFVNLMKAQELVRVTEDIVKIRRNSLELIALRFQGGLEHKGALLTAEANMAEADFELSQAKRGIGSAQRQLINRMGRRDFNPIEAKGDFTIDDAAKQKPDFDMIAKNNPSVLQAAAKKNAAAFNVKSAYGDFYPSISGSAGTDKTGAKWPPRNTQADAGVSVTMPIFEGGLKTAQLSQAKAAYNQAEADERTALYTVVGSLEQTWAAFQDAIETVDVQRKTLDAAQERSKIAEAQYATGFITFDNWIIIEDALVSAKRAYLGGQANALLAEAGWIQAKGETLEYAK